MNAVYYSFYTIKAFMFTNGICRQPVISCHFNHYEDEKDRITVLHRVDHSMFLMILYTRLISRMTRIRKKMLSPLTAAAKHTCTKLPVVSFTSANIPAAVGINQENHTAQKTSRKISLSRQPRNTCFLGG